VRSAKAKSNARGGNAVVDPLDRVSGDLLQAFKADVAPPSGAMDRNLAAVHERIAADGGGDRSDGGDGPSGDGSPGDLGSAPSVGAQATAVSKAGAASKLAVVLQWLKLASIGGVMGAALVAGLVVASDGGDSNDADTASALVAVEDSNPSSPESATAAPAPPSTAETPVSEVAVEGDAVPREAPRRADSRNPRKRPEARAASVTVPEPAPLEEDTDAASLSGPGALREQTRMIGEMKAALDGRRFDRVESLAKQYEARYGDGVFGEERDALRVLAACSRGDDRTGDDTSDGGTRMARRFLQRHPNSPRRGDVSRTCGLL
jgi:hypothetical protein